MCGAVGAAGGMPVQQMPGQVPGQVAGESGPGAPPKKSDVAGASGSPTQADVGQKAIGGGSGDIASVLQRMIEQLRALASQVAGTSGGGMIEPPLPPQHPRDLTPGQTHPPGPMPPSKQLPPGPSTMPPGHAKHHHHHGKGRGHDKHMTQVGGMAGIGAQLGLGAPVQLGVATQVGGMLGLGMAPGKATQVGGERGDAPMKPPSR